MIGETILHYKILEKLGEGGMGVVYLAEDTKLKRKVAIKFLPKNITVDAEERQRFEIEAQAAASLNHPNITTIHAIEESDEKMFIVMEFIDGMELKEKIKSGPLSFDETLNVAIQIAKGLSSAHKKGIVHRDIKSANIMIAKDGNAKIMDFGLAKIGRGEQVTKAGTTIGTIAYMSPEQATGEEIDHRTDIWSFGVVLYEMLTGEMPFKGDYDQATIYCILNEEPKNLNNPGNNIIQNVVKKTLKKDKGERYNQIDDIITDLNTGSIDEQKAAEVISRKGIKKLALLPFTNIINDAQTNFLGFALADQVIGAMVYSKNVLVRPSSAIRKYQNEVVDIEKAASDLNVDFVLTGNYLKESDIIRLNIELVDINKNEMIWRETIQLKYKNVFELQDIVSQKIVEGLQIQFSDEERERMKAEIPQNPAAYEFYLRAVSYPQTIDGNNLAIEMLNNSITLDSTFALAHLELGIRYNALSQVGKDAEQFFDKAEKSLLKALSLNNSLLPALAYLALVYTDIGRHEEAHNLLIKAVKINPNDSWLHFSLSYHYRYIGFLEESEKEINIALSIDPKNPRFRSGIITFMFLGKYDEAIELFDLDSESPFTLNLIGEVIFRKGDKKLALDYFEKSLKVKDEIGEFYFASSFAEMIKGNFKKAADYNLKRELENPADGEIWYEIARIYGNLKMEEDCYRALKRSIELGYINFTTMLRDPFLDPVRNSSGIEELINKAKAIHEDFKNKLMTTY